MDTLSEAIKHHFGDYVEYEDEIKILLDNDGNGTLISSCVFITAIFASSYVYSIYIESSGFIMSGVLISILFLSMRKNFTQYIQSVKYEEQGTLRQWLYKYYHFMIYFTPTNKTPYIPDQEIIRFWLYKLWMTDDEDELENNIENFLRFVQGDCNRQPLQIQNHEVEAFVKQLENNPHPEYRKQTVSENLETILRHIIEFETESHVFRDRERFVDFESDDRHLNNLVEELNKSYQYKLDSTVFILSRKFTENLIIKFYIKHFPERKAHYSDEDNRTKNLNQLKNQISGDLEELSQYTPMANQKLIKIIDKIKDDGNTHTHNADVLQRENELVELKENIGLVIEAFDTLDEQLSNDQ